jgi:hypothetical protein
MKKVTVFRIALKLSSPVRRAAAVERRRQVNSMQAFVGRLSRRSAILSRGDC